MHPAPWGAQISLVIMFAVHNVTKFVDESLHDGIHRAETLEIRSPEAQENFFTLVLVQAQQAGATLSDQALRKISSDFGVSGPVG